MYYNLLINNQSNKYVKRCLDKLKHLQKYIIDKCDNPKNVKFHNYGGRGVTYDHKWKDFNVFLKDITEIDGFSPLAIINGKISLDKDLKNYKKKIYSKETCSWVSNEDNERLKPSRLNTYYAYSYDKNLTFIFNQKADFAKQFDISERVVIAQTIRSNSKHSNISKVGWTFWSATDIAPKLRRYIFSNSKNNIHIESFTQTKIEKIVGLSGGTFNKLIRSHDKEKALADNSQHVLINGKKYDFNSMNQFAKFLNVSRSSLTSKMNKFNDFKIKDYHIVKLSNNSILGYIKYVDINPYQNMIDIRK